VPNIALYSSVHDIHTKTPANRRGLQGPWLAAKFSFAGNRRGGLYRFTEENNIEEFNEKLHAGGSS
jgi:hypothetical protein